MKHLIVAFAALITIFVFAFCVLILTLVLSDERPAWSHTQVTKLVDELNNAAGIDTPHRNLGKTARDRNLPLFQKVEEGQELTATESASYRMAYQAILRENQSYLRMFDWSLTVLTDHGMQQPNNTGGAGIPGQHDHHDDSARRNFQAVNECLNKLAAPRHLLDSPERIYCAIVAYKDLTDIILHLATAPQTKSVPHMATPGGSPLAVTFEEVLRNYKSAQFHPVNSKSYVESLRKALDNYDSLVLEVQHVVVSGLEPWERRVAGRWLSWQQLGPPLEGRPPPRFQRHREGKV